MNREDFLSSIDPEDAAEFCRIEDLLHTYEDLPDGTFFGVLEEHGIGSEELAWFYDTESEFTQ